MASPAKRQIFVGAVGHNLNADDVARVGLNLVHASLDLGLKLPGPKDQQEKVDDADTSAVQSLGLEDAEQMTAPAVRATLFVKLVELATARAPPRAEVLHFLVALLNADVLPALPSAGTDAAVLERLVGAFYGAGAALHPASSTFAAVLEKAQIVAPKLTPLEKASVTAGSSPSLAVLCLSLAASKRLLGVADCVAAVTCEVLQSNVLSFETEAMEACPHKFELQAASDLSALLEGSKQVNPRKGGNTPRSVAALPQIHGRAREAVQVATTATGVQLNAVAAGVSAKAVRAPGSTAVANAAASLLSALAAVGSASASRSAALESAAVAETPEGRVADVLRSEAARIAGSLAGILADADEARPPTLDAPSALAAALPKLVQLLSHELEAASTPLLKQEAEAAAPPAPAPAAGADGSAADGAKEKDKKKGKGAQGVVLGKGSTLAVAFAKAGGKLDLLSPAVEALLEAAKEILANNASRRKPKIPKGTRDFLPEQMAIREKAFGAIVGVFKRHGAVALDTPVFELRETLMGKYGEDSKLIYDLADQGGEILSLRYDLTVPFARYLAMHNVGNIKRYHIARVYRRDQPQMARGRFREFYQCDFDIAGAYPVMMADAEVLKVMTEILSELNIGAFCVRLNDRRLLDAIFEVAGIPASKFRTVCSSVDKLDKEPWADVRREIIEDKGLSPEMADAVGRFVQLKSPVGSPRELLAVLQGPDSPYKGNAGAAAALAEMDLLFGYLEALRALPNIQFDMSLARGLDYYTGPIYEAVLTGGGTNVGSIGGGGRYDNLVGMFSSKQVPCVGVCVGIERVFNIMEERERAASAMIRATQTEVMVASIGAGLVQERMSVCAELWAAGFKAEYLAAQSPNMQKQLTHALESGIPFMVIFGGDELANKQLKIKNLATHDEVTIPRDGLVEEIRKLLGSVSKGPQPVVVS